MVQTGSSEEFVYAMKQQQHGSTDQQEWLLLQVVVFKVCWSVCSHHCRSSSCGVCDGAALSQANHRSVIYRLLVLNRCFAPLQE